MNKVYDLAVVGAGIVGLAHAYAAACRGKRVVVLEREAQPVGASIRNFGFVTVTGQAAGDTWRRARRTRDVWARIAPQAGIAVEHRGLLLTMRRPESLTVAEAFLKTEMGAACRLLDRADAAARLAAAERTAILGALESPHELRVDSRSAIRGLIGWLQERWGVDFLFETAVHDVAPPTVRTARGTVEAGATVVCPGDDLASIFPERIKAAGIAKCRLNMLRLEAPGFRLPAALMSDLGLTRYLGYAALPEAAALRARLATEQPDHVAHGIHLIVVQNGDGSLVVGDSHRYGAAPEPFGSAQTDALILDELRDATGIVSPVVERWTGQYAVSDAGPVFIDAPAEATRLVIVTSGTGASTAFAIAEEVLGGLFDEDFGADA